MERLTKREKGKMRDGKYIVLCNYKQEDCNDSCMKIQKCKWEEKALRKLKEYEDLEERGRLLRLPVAIGDMVYTLNPLENGKVIIAETTADAFFCALCALEDRFDKTVFPTYEEAKAALERREKERC